jgi:signal transduction histidine kinase
LIEQLLDLSQLHAGMLKIIPSVFNFGDIVEQAHTHLETVTQAHQFSAEIAPDLPSIFVDKNRMVQVIHNLVQNSVKYSAPHSRIVLAVYQENGHIRCDVIDEGIGIPLEYRESVFEAFHQLADGKKGIGLGLAICKGLIEAHGGRIWIEDQPRPGTTVSFILPVVK